MKAVLCPKYGSPQVLQLKEVAKPTPKDDEVLIKIHATTVNRTDCATLRATPFFARFFTGLFKPKHPIIGTEFAGTVAAVGKSVRSLKVGEKVFGLKETGSGAHAEYMTMAEDKALATIPEGITYEQAAASTEGAWYAYNFINKVDMKRGQKVLVYGATGGIGSATVQLSRHFGARITGVCRSEHFELVRSLGAEKMFDYEKEDFTRSNERYHYVFDTVGKSSFRKCKPLLMPGGVYISSELGFMYQNLFLPLLTRIFGRRKVKFPLPTDCRGTILLIKKLMEKERFKPVIDRKYPLEQIIDAFEYVEKGQKIGNVVITLDKSHKK